MGLERNRLDIRTGGAVPPLTVDSASLVANLNADLLDGLHASAFALASHSHSALSITSDVLATARIGTGSPTARTALFGRPLAGGATTAEWRGIQLDDLAFLTSNDFMRGFLSTVDNQMEALAYIGAAPSSHGHVVADVVGAVSYLGALTQYRVPYWNTGGQPQLATGPIAINSLVHGDIGLNGSVTCNDLILNYTGAPGPTGIPGGTNFAAAVFYNLSTKLVSSPTVTVNVGPSTISFTASGSTWLPAAPTEDGPWVLVRASGVFSWRKLVGDGVGIN